MMTTKSAPARLQEPVENSLDRVSKSHSSKFDRSTVWTVRGEQPPRGTYHELNQRCFPARETSCLCCFNNLYFIGVFVTFGEPIIGLTSPCDG